mgnify:CR=1 FL=1
MVSQNQARYPLPEAIHCQRRGLLLVTCQRQGAEILITLEPNRSATRRQTWWFLLLVAGVTFSVALFWALFGEHDAAPLVLPCLWIDTGQRAQPAIGSLSNPHTTSRNRNSPTG